MDHQRGINTLRSQHPPGCHSASPRSWLAEPMTGGKRQDISFDPCGRTCMGLCDHKGRGGEGASFPAGRSGAFAPSDAGAS